MEIATEEPVGPVEPSSFRKAVEWTIIIGGSLLVAVVLRTFVIQAFSIPSESMERTLLIGDRVIVDKISYRFGDPQRGDIVVFDRPPSLPSDYNELIKRIIGLPGETVEGRDGSVLIDGVPLAEPYLQASAITEDFGPVVIPEGELFMMGDNRTRSSDSRVFGPIERSSIVGRADFRYWPLSRIGGL